MNTLDNSAQVANRFGGVAHQFCSLVDSAASMDRKDLLVQIYRILPTLIGEAISLPDVRLSDNDDEAEGISRPTSSGMAPQSQQGWGQLYNLLKERLGDWDSYSQVLDPTTGNEVVRGSLADDIADIYRDLRKGLVLNETDDARPESIIWTWRVLFYSHWGQHAMDALRTMHFRLDDTLS
jgi:hypothetical protein